MRDPRGISQVLVIGILVVVIAITAVAFVLLPKGPVEPTATTTPTTTTPTATKTITETATETTTITAETTPSVTSPTATETETPATTTETTETTSAVTLPEIEYAPPGDVTDLLRIAKSMRYQWTSAEDVARYSYEVLGEESIGAVVTWKVKVQFTNDDTQEFTVWISQVDGVIQQAEVNGDILTGEMAKNFQAMVALLMLPFLSFEGYSWAWQEYWKLPGNVGVVTYQGSQTQSFGPTTLSVQKFRFEPNPAYEPAQNVKYVEWGFAQLDSIGVATHFKVEEKTGEVFRFDLVSVTRV